MPSPARWERVSAPGDPEHYRRKIDLGPEFPYTPTLSLLVHHNRRANEYELIARLGMEIFVQSYARVECAEEAMHMCEKAVNAVLLNLYAED